MDEIGVLGERGSGGEWGRVGGERGSGGEGEWGRVLGERGRGREWGEVGEGRGQEMWEKVERSIAHTNSLFTGDDCPQ